MKLITVDTLFYLVYGVNLELNKMEIMNKGIPFVSRCSTNNGVSAIVKEINIEPNPAHTISVAGSGSVLESFYQEIPYYSGRDLFYLKPKQNLNKNEMLFYCVCLRKNRYRYSYGRQANKTLAKLLIPSPEEIPKHFLNFNIEQPSRKSIINKKHVLDVVKWKWFLYKDIFTIENGYYNRKPEIIKQGTIPFIGATENNNGITDYYSIDEIEETNKSADSKFHSIEDKIFKENCITVSNNGSVGFAFYQKQEFTCSHDVNVLYLKNQKWNPYLAMFITTLIQLEQFRWIMEENGDLNGCLNQK